MEAMSTGLPVTRTYHSGIPELIKDGVNGYLVPERDITLYVEKIKEVLNTDVKISLNARATIEENFNLEKQSQKLIHLYNKIGID